MLWSKLFQNLLLPRANRVAIPNIFWYIWTSERPTEPNRTEPNWTLPNRTQPNLKEFCIHIVMTLNSTCPYPITPSGHLCRIPKVKCKPYTILTEKQKIALTMAQNHNFGFGKVRYFYWTEPDFGLVKFGFGRSLCALHDSIGVVISVRPNIWF